MANAIIVIRRDHRAVKIDYKRFLGARSGTERTKIANHILDSLDAHAYMEEALFYPAARERGSDKARELIKNAYEEHAEMKKMIARVREEMDEPALNMKMEELIGGVLHHARDEEGKLLPEVRRAIQNAALMELGARMEEFSPSSGKTLPEQLAERARAEARAFTNR